MMRKFIMFYAELPLLKVFSEKIFYWKLIFS